MYRLNETQQQPQQTTTKQIRSAIPSHIFLQQQLTAPAVSVVAGVSPCSSLSVSASPSNNSHASLTVHVVGTANGGATATASPPLSASAAQEKPRQTLTAIKIEPMLDAIALSTAGVGATVTAHAVSPETSTPNKSTSAVAAAASTSATASASGLLVLVSNKRPRLDAAEEWMSTPSPGSIPSSAPLLSPSPGSQNHSYNMSNGYASPMSASSYDYSPNGKAGELTIQKL
ncbi:hypothetical protein KR009_005137 [Drosophila setifemur]|nr:hypothetical protein KR009_005137 [Drosophila setifemur]